MWCIETLGSNTGKILTEMVCSFVPFAPIPAFVIKMIICCVVPNIFFALCYFKTKEFKQGLLLMKNAVRR